MLLGECGGECRKVAIGLTAIDGDGKIEDGEPASSGGSRIPKVYMGQNIIIQIDDYIII